MAIIKSKPGQEVAHIPAGPFKIRFPILHYRLEVMDFILALFLCCCCLSAMPMISAANPHLPYEVVWDMVIVMGLLYILQVMLGDPLVPGWITPSIALTTVFLQQFEEGAPRMQALFAVQFLVAVIYLFMGATGLATKLVGVVPNAMKAGILMGAALSACWGELKTGGRFGLYPIAAGVCTALAIFLLFSNTYQELRKKYKILDFIGRFGMVPAFLVCVVVAPLVGECAWPDFSAISLTNLIRIPDFGQLIAYCSPFALGFPGIDVFLKCLPQAIVIYIIGFGDFVTCKALTKEAQELRNDEKIFFNPNRSNLICGIRNLLCALICPNICMCGPIGAPLEIAILNRYKDGKKAMESIWSGMGTFRIGTAFAVAFVPIVAVLSPILPPAVSVSMFVQAFSMGRVAVDQAKDKLDLSIMVVMGTFLLVKGATWALGAGIILYIVACDKVKILSDFRTSMAEVKAEKEAEQTEQAA